MSYKIFINKEECIGCGSCTISDNWEIDSEGKAEPVKNIISDEEFSGNNEAAEVCPVDAIEFKKV